MKTLAKVMRHPCLLESPPVLVDVGASGELHPAWRRIAGFAKGVGFEPDTRERPAIAKYFREWVTVPKIVVSDPDLRATSLVLTRFPFCSSTLQPDHSGLAEWAFAGLFDMAGSKSLDCTTLAAGLEAHGVGHLDWLKCDTQGTDLRIWMSLPSVWKARVLTAEFEPGLIDAYLAEDKLHQVLAAMDGDEFWLAKFEPQSTLRARAADLERWLGGAGANYARKYGPGAPAWANVVYLRTLRDAGKPVPVGLRERLLRWVFAMELAQPAHAAMEAERGASEHEDPIFDELKEAALRELRRRLRATWPRVIWRRVVRSLRGQ